MGIAVVASAVELLKCSSLYLNFVVYDSPTSAIMTEITDEQLEELKEAFTLFDKVGDDKIASEDVIKLLQSLKLNPLTADLKEMFKCFDREGNEMVFGGEFRQVMNNLGDAMDEKDIDFFIGPLENGDGYVAYEDLIKHVMNG